MEVLTPNIDTLADYIDRLIVEVSKLSFLEGKKREEQLRENPDPVLIMKWDRLSRDACEFRSQIKTKINKLFEEVIKSKEYRTLTEVRTFTPPNKPVEELLADRCWDQSTTKFKAKLINAVAFELSKMDK